MFCRNGGNTPFLFFKAGVSNQGVASGLHLLLLAYLKKVTASRAAGKVLEGRLPSADREFDTPDLMSQQIGYTNVHQYIFVSSLRLVLLRRLNLFCSFSFRP
jgi:hypothetical protein